MARTTKPRIARSPIARLGIVALLPLLLSGCWWWGPHHHGYYGHGPGYYH